ncbi:hypothetical protein P154DRAFT_525076 [Amniculicola lignicola CBS 123094]|uniref:Uncharacterized protein n=1 Tax=Amniculicola lignicola CBS 123094 TaxID=1392246 RepID=A0A6A5W6W6_9PLEO|nr:hypothetical protein P154DRAFT_525076 [Amniculicola lignicola CBS 123094]
MFTRAFNTAKRILSRSPSAQGRSSEEKNSHVLGDNDLTDNMVTTRQGTDVDSVGDTPRSTPRSTRNGKRALESELESTPTEPKRRRRSTRVANLVAEEEQPPAVEVTSTPTIEEKLPVRVRKSPKGKKGESPVDAETVTEIPTSTQETEPDTPEVNHDSSVDEGSRPKQSKEDGSQTPGPKTKVQVVIKTPVSSKRRKEKKSPVKDAEDIQADSTAPTSQLPDEIPSSTFDSEKDILSTQESEQEPEPEAQVTSPPKAKKAHIRFGSEEPEDKEPIVLHQPARTRFVAEDEDASDSDDAPEEVTAASALSKTKAAEEDATRAFKAQQEKEKKKREERLLRTTQEQAEKRKREEKKAKKLAKALSKQKDAEPEREPLDIDIYNLPALLPDSLLETIGDKRPPTPPPILPGLSAAEVQKQKLNRHIKFLERGEKPIKDVKKGSINVALLQQQNKFLAPKVNRDTKNVRERWLQGRLVEKKKGGKGKGRLEHKKMHRRAVGAGFLRGEE